MQCPACQSPMTPGTVDIHGNSLGFLLVGFSWQELYFKPEPDAKAESILAPSETRYAFRCPACRLVVIRPERRLSETETRAAAAEPSECLACGAPLASGEVCCARCGWTYKNPPPAEPTPP